MSNNESRTQFNKALLEMTQLLLQAERDPSTKPIVINLIKSFIELFIASGVKVPQRVVDRAKLLLQDAN